MRRADVVYAILPPLPLGVAAWGIALASRAKLVVNVQDIYPDVAVALHYLTNPLAIRLSGLWSAGFIGAPNASL